MNERKLNKKKVIFTILFFLFILCMLFGRCFIALLNNKFNYIDKSEQNNVESIASDGNNIVLNNETTNEISSSTKSDYYLDNLSVPTYKIGEKNIKIPILIYHAFGTPMPDDDKYNLFSCKANFEENVTTMLTDGYTFIHLEDLYKYYNGEVGFPEKVALITMDDGWLGCYTEAYPVLKAYNVPATIFIVNKLVGTNGYFSWDQAKEMYDSGLVKIHCHGYSHIEYSSVSKEKLQGDYEKSHAEICEHLGDNSIQKIMAYPAGKSSADSIAWLKEIGFEIQVQTKYGTVNMSNSLDLTALGRIRAEKSTGTSLLKIINNAKFDE